MRVGPGCNLMLGLLLLRMLMIVQLTQPLVLGDSNYVIRMEVLPPSSAGGALPDRKPQPFPEVTSSSTKVMTSSTNVMTSSTKVMTSSTETPPILRTKANVVTTPTTMPVPTIEYFMFLKNDYFPINDDNNNKTDPPATKDDRNEAGFLLWVSLLGVGCFLTGVIITGFVAFGFYRRLGCKCRIHCRASHNVHNDLEAQTDRQRPPTSGMESEPLRQNSETSPSYNRWSSSLVEQLLIHGNNSAPYSTFRGLDNPWVNQFQQLITKQIGGDITHPHSDVIVSLLPDSFDRYTHRPIHVNVAIGGEDFNLDMGSTDIQLTPVVEVTTIGVQQFSKPVTIRIPHRACISDFSQWQMTLYYTTSPLGHSTSWSRRSQSTELSDVSFTYDRNYVYIETLVAGTFVCAGVGRKQATLSVCSVAYVNWQKNSRHLQLSVYICDNYTDMHKYINDLESSRNGVRASHHQSLSVYNMKDWLIKLHSASSPIWPWAEVDDDYNQAISMNEIVRRPVGPSSVTFRLRCKETNRPLEDFQATFTIAQVRKDPTRSDNMYLVTRNVSMQELPGFSVGGMRRKSVHEPEDESLC